MSTQWQNGIAIGLTNSLINEAGSFLPLAGSFFMNIENGLANAYDILSGSNSKLVYDSSVGPVNGLGLALDVLSFSKAGEILGALSNSLGVAQGFTDFLPATVKDAIVQSFLDISNYSVLGKAENKEEAIELADKFSNASIAYYTKGLANKGVSKSDWATAIKDVMQGRENELYKKYMEANQ